jgi:hypothetical protein
MSKEETVVVKIPDTNRMIIVEFENKGSIIGIPSSFYEAWMKYMSSDMEFVAPYPPKTDV